MILTIVIAILVVISLISAIIFFYEVKHAPLIEDDDYMPKEEEVVKYCETFCQHCKFFDGTATCLHEDIFGVLNNHLVDLCKKDSFFEAK